MTAAIHVEHVMGMVVTIDVREPFEDAGALGDVIAWLHEIDARFSTYRDDSEITRLGRGELTLSDLSADCQDVLRTCCQLTDVTGGAFDAFAVPAPNGTMLDPSGFVKGWSIERAAFMLERAGAVNFCVNAGGDIVLRGEPRRDDKWVVGVRHPDHRDKFALTLALRGPAAVATSATYERGAHIIDPATSSATTELASATVVGPDLGRADAFATAVFVMGADGIAWIETQPGYDAYIITHDGMTQWSSGFPHPRLTSVG